MGAAWRNCLGGSSDVKELIPEFYYLPEFLANTDGHHLGVRQVEKPCLLAPNPSLNILRVAHSDTLYVWSNHS